MRTRRTLCKSVLAAAVAAAPALHAQAPAAVSSAASAPPAATAASPSATPAALPSDAGPAPSSPSPSTGASSVRSGTTCTEHLPAGKARPDVIERFPSRGQSGHAAVLEVRVRHGRGERVLPGALEVQTDSEAAKALTGAGFILPDPNGPGRPRVERRESESAAQSVVRIPVVPLPKEPGRHELVLPALPIAMARASGEVITLCTTPHAIHVEDPTANQPHAEPKGNPAPRRQLELWEGLRNATYGGLAGLSLALILALVHGWWRRRPRPMPPPPPPRPAWEVALEALHDIRHAQLVEQGRLEVHLERVSNTLRVYLGERYGFDGLECTTDEIVARLARRADAANIRDRATRLLGDADLVKFADVQPEAAQCLDALETTERIVRETTPTQPPRDTAGGGPNGGAP